MSNSLNEAAKLADLVDKLLALSNELQNAARVRGKPEPSRELLEEAAFYMFCASERISHILYKF